MALQGVVNLVRKIEEGFPRKFQTIERQKVIVRDIDENASVKPVVRAEHLFRLTTGLVSIGETVNGPVERDSFLDRQRIIELLFAFYKIADDITHEDFRVAKRKTRVGQVVQSRFCIKVPYILFILFSRA